MLPPDIRCTKVSECNFQKAYVMAEPGMSRAVCHSECYKLHIHFLVTSTSNNSQSAMPRHIRQLQIVSTAAFPSFPALQNAVRIYFQLQHDAH